MEKNLNHEESLSLINEMILRTQNNVKKGQGNILIFIGYLTTVLALIHSFIWLVFKQPGAGSFVWILMIPAYIVINYFERRTNREKRIKTHIDKINATLWLGYSISVFIFLSTIFTISIKFEIESVLLLCTPVILIMVGMAQFSTACIYRSKMWYAIATLFWTSAIACIFINVKMHLIIFAICMILGYVVPGYLLNYKAKQNHV